MRVASTAIALAFVLVLGTFRTPDVGESHRSDRRTTASWYDAAGLTGACGGTMDHRSAASKWFPCGAKVMVVRPNGRHVQVVIRDRCQCGIDLDREAARAIGISGVAKVAVAKVHPGYRHEHDWFLRWMKR